ncbi:hypothetical protein [Ancylobacter defluvii]|uniref:Uncharacterized protein n=1 Tax=Ancylobacter defluvii TaxID=1282440 RepID=A0A9W6NDM4_9HYPH|nr:hypothetical protein [Ancylobacter defluvii]MBS7588299.1 hypothetical protein [Ancylobacter defluvii]GLK86696.1 hypothetical protein GCM10017653_47660 [Ancylobacter defluvii]
MISIEEWSAHLTPRNSFFELKGLVSSGGRVADGREQRVQDDVGFWRVSYSFAIRNRAQALAYRALLTRLRAGENIVAKVFDAYGVTVTNTAATPSASVAVDAELRATTLNMWTMGLDLEPGISFSIGNRLHRITEIVARTAGSVGTWSDAGTWNDAGRWMDAPAATADGWEIRFMPPLREVIDAGTVVDFINLQCLCVIENVTDGDMDLELGFFGDPTLPLIETI